VCFYPLLHSCVYHLSEKKKQRENDTTNERENNLRMESKLKNLPISIDCLGFWEREKKEGMYTGKEEKSERVERWYKELQISFSYGEQYQSSLLVQNPVQSRSQSSLMSESGTDRITEWQTHRYWNILEWSVNIFFDFHSITSIRLFGTLKLYPFFICNTIQLCYLLSLWQKKNDESSVLV